MEAKVVAPFAANCWAEAPRATTGNNWICWLSRNNSLTETGGGRHKPSKSARGLPYESIRKSNILRIVHSGSGFDKAMNFGTSKWLAAAAVCGLWCAAASCTDEAAGPMGSGAAGGASMVVNTQPQEANYRPCPRHTRVGEFAVTSDPVASTTTFQGSVKNDVDPRDTLQEVSHVGDCRLLNSKARQCSPACPKTKPACGSTGCVAEPIQLTAGTITVTGVAGGIAATPSNAAFYSNDGTIPHPGVVEGADVTLSASGADHPAFTLLAKGIAPLEFTTKTPMVKKATPVSLAWKPPAVTTGARIHIVMTLDNHGGTGQQIECDVPDTGSFAIPATLVDALSTLGLSGLPTMTVSRRSVESKTLGAGCVEFNVMSQLVLDVEVEGLISCNADKPCPAGRQCQGNQTCK